MNPIKKLKLKAQLRNCDYVLAGTVIKQQYYDTTKNIEINRLIDQFMTNPGFETALKLIEFNDMMVFYFTESCEGGLYVRKTMQQTDKITETEDGEDTADRSDSVRDGNQGPASEIASVSSVPPAAQAGSAATSETKSGEKKEAAAKKSAKQDLLRKIDQRRNGAAANSEEEQAVSEVSAAAEAARTSAKPAKAETQQRQAASRPTDAVAEAAQAAAINPKPAASRSADAQAPASGSSEARASAAQPAADARPSRTAANQSAGTRSSNADKPAAAKSVITKQRRQYPNVIATLQLDIHTMTKQLDEYKRELNRNPANDKQLKAWIKSLEDAIREFHLAIDLLEEGR